MAKIQSLTFGNSGDDSQDFLENMESNKEGNLSPEERIDRELKVAKSGSIHEVQNALTNIFGLEGRMDNHRIDELMNTVRGRVTQSLTGMAETMRTFAPDPISKQLWEIGGANISRQISECQMTGLNSVELGRSYTEHLKIARKYTMDEWRRQDKRNKAIFTEAEKIRPFIRGWKDGQVMSGTMARNLSGRVNTPVTRILSAGLLGTTGVFAGAAAGTAFMGLRLQHLQRIAASIVTGFSVGSLPGAIIGGGVGIAAGVWLPKYLEGKRKAIVQKEKDDYEKEFSPKFQKALEDKFNEYDAVAKEIENNGEEQADSMKDYIEATLDLAGDEERARLINLLVSVKKNTEPRIDLTRITEAFQLATPPNDQFQITFYEAIKRLDWIDNTMSVQRRLELRAAQDETFTKSAWEQERAFRNKLKDTPAINTMLKDFETLRTNAEFSGLPVYEKEGDVVTSESLLKDIYLDINQHPSIVKMPEFKAITDSVGLTESAKVIIVLDKLLQEKDTFLKKGTGLLSVQTKQKILKWVQQEDVKSLGNLQEKNKDVTNFVHWFEGGETTEDGKKIQTFADLVEEENSKPSAGVLTHWDALLKSLDEYKFENNDKSEFLALKSQAREFSQDVAVNEARFENIKNNIPEADRKKIEDIFGSLKKYQKEISAFFQIAYNNVTGKLTEKKDFKKDQLDAFENMIEEINTFSTKLKAVKLSESLKSYKGFSNHDQLHKRLKGNLFKEFSKDMETRIIKNWAQNDPYEVLKTMKKMSGHIQLDMIDHADALQNINLPDDLNRKETLQMTITKNSNANGIEMETTNTRGQKLRVYLLGSLIKKEDKESAEPTLYKNARIYEIDSSGKATQAREAFLTNLRFIA